MPPGGVPASGLLCPLLSEPICAIGHGVAALCSATNEDGSWVFQGYSVTGVSAAPGSRAVVRSENLGAGWDPLRVHGHIWQDHHLPTWELRNWASGWQLSAVLVPATPQAPRAACGRGHTLHVPHPMAWGRLRP